MASPDQMKVRLVDLPQERTVLLGNAFVREAIAGLPVRVALGRRDDDDHAGDATAVLSLYLEDNNVFVSGTVTGWMEIACGRCLGEVGLRLDETIAVSYLPKEVVPDDDDLDDGEVSVTEDDDDVFPYEGEEIDLEQLLRERLVLAVPYAPLCRAECKGLCSTCGIDLNHTNCSCERGSVDLRLAALKGFKL